MFTCIEILHRDERLVRKIYERIIPPAPVREYVQLRGATPFLRLSVRENNVDWIKISSMLSGNERIVVKDDSVAVPESLSLKTYIPVSLGMKLMFRTLCQTLERVDLPQKINLTVFDRNAHMAKELVEIIPYIRNLYVYTEKISEYFFCASKIMEEYGASVKVSEYETAQQQAGIVFADEYLSVMKKADFVFVADKSIISYNTITGNGIFLEEEYKILKGESIDDFCFASALFEMNGAKFFSQRDFVLLFLSNKTVTVSELAEKIRQSVVSSGNT